VDIWGNGVDHRHVGGGGLDSREFAGCPGRTALIEVGIMEAGATRRP